MLNQSKQEIKYVTGLKTTKDKIHFQFTYLIQKYYFCYFSYCQCDDFITLNIRIALRKLLQQKNMQTITFSKNKYEVKFETDAKPEIIIKDGVMFTTDNKWFNKLNTTTLYLETIGVDKDNNHVTLISNTINLGIYLNLEQRQPVFTINHLESFTHDQQTKTNSVLKWETRILLKEIELNEEESIKIRLTIS